MGGGYSPAHREVFFGTELPASAPTQTPILSIHVNTYPCEEGAGG